MANPQQEPKWLKGRGYLHITPKIDVARRRNELITKVHDEKFVERHAFFPLIHSVIKERKYKKSPSYPKKRSHLHKVGGKVEKTAKLRPLHYSTHIDSIIFGFYAQKLLDRYEVELEKHSGLTACITAYRKITIDGFEESDTPGKSTIHFASEAFEEIKTRASDGCIVLMFDIKSFFNELNHNKLKQAWCKLIGTEKLSPADYNVFNAATNFKYILLDELRVKRNSNGRRYGFNEKKLAHNRKEHGVEAFFESVEAFRDAIKNGEFRVYRRPFVKDKQPVGIPQGLPISSVLANLYLLEFDVEVIETVVNKLNGFYRRYSDDILVICDPINADEIETFMNTRIKKSHVTISESKTEKYYFRNFQISPNKTRLTSILLQKDRSVIGKPLTYLGFEFYGYKTLIKSSNIAKFYRRLIYAVKKKAHRARKISENTMSPPIIFKGDLKRKYSQLDLNSDDLFTKRKKLVRNQDGNFSVHIKDIPRKHKTNYFSYILRASKILNEPAIKEQLRKNRAIFHNAIFKHLKKGKITQ